MTADTTQPAGALPEPIGHLHSDGVFCLDRAIPEPTLWPVDLCLAEDMRALMADRDAWRDKAHRTDLLAEKLMYQRDAAREEAASWRRVAERLESEAAALRRELESYRSAGMIP